MSQHKNQGNETFSQRVRKYRDARGLSQEELAKTLGVSRNWISLLEAGEPPSERLQQHFSLLESGAGSVQERPATEYPVSNKAEEEILRVIRGGPADAVPKMGDEELLERIREHVNQMNKDRPFMRAAHGEIIVEVATELYRRLKKSKEEQK